MTTLNGQPIPASAPAGRWKIVAPANLTVLGPGKQPKLWSKLGTLEFDAVAGVTYAMSWSGGFARVTATATTTARKCIVGTSTPPGSKKIAADRIVHEGSTLFRLVSSDGVELEQVGGYEADEIAWFRSINPTAKIIGSIANGWKTRWMQVDEFECRQYVKNNLSWIAQLDIVSGPNEPEIYGDGNTASHIAKIRQCWAWIVDELVKQGVARSMIAGIEWYRGSLIREDCAKHDVCCIHTHDDGGNREVFLDDIRARVGNRPLYLTETSWPEHEPTQEDQAKGMKLTMDRAVKVADGAIYYVGRSDPKELQFDYVAILNPDATPRPAMLSAWRSLIGHKPVVIHDGTWNRDRPDRNVPIVAGVKSVMSLKPGKPTDVAMHANGLAAGTLGYIDHLTDPEDDYFAPEARAARYMPAIDAARAVGVPVILYSTIGRGFIGLNPGNTALHARIRAANDAFWRIVGPKCHGVGYSAYVLKSHPASVAALDTTEAVRLAAGKPVIAFVSIAYGDDPATFVPIDRFKAQVRAVCDAGATDVVVWAGLADVAVCRAYIEAAKTV